MGAPDRPMFLFIYRTGLGMYLTSDECSIATLSALPTLHDADSDGTRPDGRASGLRAGAEDGRCAGRWVGVRGRRG